MKVLTIFLAGALGIGAAACATVPPYHPLKGGVGYSDTQLQQNRFTVNFDGNSSTPRSQVDNFLLYRAAQLTLANGYDYFIVSNQATDKSTSYQTFGYGPRWIGPGWYRPGWHSWWGIDPVVNDSDTIPSNRFDATATITMGKGPAPANNHAAYDAQQLINNLGPTVAAATPTVASK